MRKQATSTALMMALAAALAAPAAADVEVARVGGVNLFLGAHTVGTVQALDQENVFDSTGKEAGELEPGFQTAWGNLELRGTFGEKEEIEMFFDLYLASRPHPSQTYGHEGWLLIRGVPENLERLRGLDRVFDFVNVKVGHFEVAFGDHIRRRSDNADVQGNRLVGNYLVDPENVEVGAEFFSTPGKPVNWLIGVGSGTNTEDFREGRGTSLHGKVWTELPQDLRLALSYYTVDHSDNAVSKSNLFAAANRGGGRYGAVLAGGQAPGEITFQAGKDVSAWQADVTWAPKPIELYAHYGRATDDDINGNVAGSPKEEWSYWTTEAVYFFTEDIFAAARYGRAEAETIGGVDSDASVSRLQAGMGFWMTKHLLAKLEYVDEQFDDFAVGQVISGVQAWQEPSFDGLVAEVSFSF